MTVDKDAKKRKEQGIYYTPSFVVDYIVKNTLGPILAECKSIADLKKIKVLDPACGSGSFLVKALEAINDKYKDFGADGGVYTKLQILTENIYGVDLDEQAVEIARLNLLINALDSKIKLPSLAKNIKNGNSLISGTDEELKKYLGKNFCDKKIKNYPNIEKHFKPFKKNLKEAKIKYGTPDKPYFYLHREREEKFFNDGPKIICGVRVKYPSFYYTEEEYYGSRALNFIKTERINLKYLTGILNSRLVFFWLKNKGKQLGDLLQIDKGPLMEIPICVGNKKQQKQIIILVDKMLSLNKELRKTPENSNKWNSIKEEVAKIDKIIDQKVYDLYGLGDGEIRVVENIT